MRVQIMSDSNLIVNWLSGKWKIDNQKFRAEGAHHAELGGKD